MAATDHSHLDGPTIELHQADHALSGSAANGSVNGKRQEKKREVIEVEIEEQGEQKKTQDMVPILGLFRFSTRREKLIMLFAACCSAANGLALPLWAMVFGDLINSFGYTQDEILQRVLDNVYIFIIIGVCSFFASWGGLGLWMLSAEIRTKKIREEYLRGILRQDMSYFDLRKPGEIPSELTSDSTEYQNGTGEKIASFVQHSVTFISGITIGLVRGWQLALVVIGITPLLGVSVALFSVLLGSYSKKGQEAYTRAGAVADEVFSSVRTVTAFNSQKREEQRYVSNLEEARVQGVKGSLVNGLAMGFANLVIFSAYGICLWFGVYLVREGVTNHKTGKAYSPGDVIGVFFTIIMGAFSIGQAGPSLQSISQARTAAFRMYRVIDTKPKIDSLSTEGRKLDKVAGNIELRHVNFSYPSRKDALIFKDFNLAVKGGQNIALVGASGSGKSTIIALLERFYDPDSGSILVDGVDLKELNIKWWRDTVGIVSQEPVLFNGTIKENITYGREGTTEEEIVQAAKAANAHQFITALDKGYDSQVGEDGSLLSGGQKQRIAIARAILKNPRILLLDEATSALDNESENLVQAALNNLTVGRTTITVAHRLSTIINSDVIYVVEEGTVRESGTHQYLMSLNGSYATLVKTQQMSLDENKDTSRQSGEGHDNDQNDEETREIDDNRRAVEAKIKNATPKLGPTAPTKAGHPKEESKNGQLHDGAASSKKKEEKASENDDPPVSNTRVFALMGRTWPAFLLGVIGACGVGVAFPLWSLVFGDMMTTLFVLDADDQETRSRVYALYFFALGCGLFLAESSKGLGLGLVGEKITFRLRELSFQSIFRQEMGFFDESKGAPRILAAHLSTDAANVHGGATGQVGTFLQVFVTLLTGVLIAFIKSWSLALVVLSIAPVLIAANVFQMKFFLGFQQKGKGVFEKAGQLASEAVTNIRTVASFNSEAVVLKRFSAMLEQSVTLGVKISHTAGIGFGFSQLSIFCGYGLYFWYGGKLVSSGDLSFGDMMKAIFSIAMASMAIGQAMQLAPDVGKATKSRDKIFSLLDRKSKIDPEADQKDSVVFADGVVEFKQVEFSYPTRPDVKVLKNLSFTIGHGQTLGLVGASGCGKSTIVSLLLRFYDVSSGKIAISGRDITSVNVKSLRSQVSIVSQEPRLLDDTIAENIRYGKPDATMEEVVQAAKSANIHDTIQTFPQGYDTVVGLKGSKLSGGQKQRVAIARALIRAPKVLLLDEATSALDANSEKIVQESIEMLMADRKRTTIVIAHRLSTVKNADVIAVMEKGVIVEMGNHEQLLARNGVYASMYLAGEKKDK